MDIKQEDLIKFWTWCGFKNRHIHFDNPIGGKEVWVWVYPDDKYLFPHANLPELTLDNLYQYAIPKLQDKGYTIYLTAYSNRLNKGFYVAIDPENGKTIEMDTKDYESNPTEALYKAISAVIDKETK